MIGSYLRNRGGRAALGALVLVLVPAGGLAAQDDVSHRQCSPDGRLCFALTTVDGAPTYSVDRDGAPVIDASQLGFLLRGAGKWGSGITLGDPVRSTADETWEQPWGESRLVVDKHNEMRVRLTEQGKIKRSIDMTISFREKKDATRRGTSDSPR